MAVILPSIDFFSLSGMSCLSYNILVLSRDRHESINAYSHDKVEEIIHEMVGWTRELENGLSSLLLGNPQ